MVILADTSFLLKDSSYQPHAEMWSHGSNLAQVMCCLNPLLGLIQEAL